MVGGYQWNGVKSQYHPIEFMYSTEKLDACQTCSAGALCHASFGQVLRFRSALLQIFSTNCQPAPTAGSWGEMAAMVVTMSIMVAAATVACAMMVLLCSCAQPTMPCMCGADWMPFAASNRLRIPCSP